MTGWEKLYEGPKGHPNRNEVSIVPLEIARCHKVAILVVSVLYVLHLAKILRGPWPAHRGHACLVEEGTGSSLYNANVRLNQAIAPRIMWLAEVVLPS